VPEKERLKQIINETPRSPSFNIPQNDANTSLQDVLAIRVSRSVQSLSRSRSALVCIHAASRHDVAQGTVSLTLSLSKAWTLEMSVPQHPTGAITSPFTERCWCFLNLPTRRPLKHRSASAHMLPAVNRFIQSGRKRPERPTSSRHADHPKSSLRGLPLPPMSYLIRHPTGSAFSFDPSMCRYLPDPAPSL